MLLQSRMQTAVSRAVEGDSVFALHDLSGNFMLKLFTNVAFIERRHSRQTV